MAVEVILPKVDMDMTEGTIAVWHVAEGEIVQKGAALFDIETDKAAMEVEAPATGRLAAVTARPGDKVPVGRVVALILAEGEEAALPATQPVRAAVPETATGPQSATAPPPPRNSVSLGKDVRATPAARAAARAGGIALGDVTGSGPQGRIQRDDVLALAAPVANDARPPGPTDWTAQPGPLHIGRRAGHGVPLVMIHGFAADSQGWAPLEKALGADRPLIRIDLPGHGRSPRRRLHGFAELARMVVDAFDEATVGLGPVHLLGHSLGGALSLAIADIRPPRIARLALIAPAGLGPEIDAATLNGIARASRVESLTPWLRRLTATPEGVGDDYARAAMRSRADPALRAAQGAMAEVLFPDGVQAFDLRPALQRLEMPATILWGRQDHILPVSQATRTPCDAALHLIDGAGHIPHIELPDRVARILARHLPASL